MFSKKLKAKGKKAVLGFSSLVILNRLIGQAIKKPMAANPSTIAHRGDYRNCVENTIEALEAAKLLQVDYVELDVVEAKDGGLFVFHDKNLSRLAEINEDISDLSSEEIKNIQIYQNDSQAWIPSLEEYLIRARSLNQKLLVEIKAFGEESENYVQNIIFLLEKYGSPNDYLIQSNNLKIVREVKGLDKGFKVGLITIIPLSRRIIKDLDFLSVPKYALALFILKLGKTIKKPIFVWTIDNEPKAIKLLKKGADGIITGESESLLLMINDKL